MDIPNVGKFLIRSQTAAISFDDFLVNDALVNKISFQNLFKVIGCNQ